MNWISSVVGGKSLHQLFNFVLAHEHSTCPKMETKVIGMRQYSSETKIWEEAIVFSQNNF
jgi:hypothetical protein